MSTKLIPSRGSQQGTDRVSRLVESLSQQIMDGSLGPGEKLNELKLSCRFGVSRAPLREAIGRLEGQRLVVRRPRQGVRVAVIPPEECIHLFHVREGLEGIAARLAASVIGDADLTALEAICSAQRSEKLSEKESLELDMNFHRMIAAATGSAFLSSILGQEFYVFYKMMRRGYHLLPDRQVVATLEHIGIVAALKARDPELAEFLMRRHVAGARRSFEKAVELGAVG